VADEEIGISLSNFSIEIRGANKIKTIYDILGKEMPILVPLLDSLVLRFENSKSYSTLQIRYLEIYSSHPTDGIDDKNPIYLTNSIY
jgi:hypothetical protein